MSVIAKFANVATATSISAAALITEDAQKHIMFLLGVGAALFAMLQKGQDIYYKYKDRKSIKLTKPRNEDQL